MAPTLHPQQRKAVVTRRRAKIIQQNKKYRTISKCSRHHTRGMQRPTSNGHLTSGQCPTIIFATVNFQWLFSQHLKKMKLTVSISTGRPAHSMTPTPSTILTLQTESLIKNIYQDLENGVGFDSPYFSANQLRPP